MAPYLQDPDPKPTFDIALEASLKPTGATTSPVIPNLYIIIIYNKLI